MFKAVHGVSTVEFLKQGMSQEAFGQTLALPDLTPSDADEEVPTASLPGYSAHSAAPACRPATWSNWKSGCAQRDSALAKGHWPDGSTVGRGHGMPYLQPCWGIAMQSGTKTVEGRPHEGVSILQPNSMRIQSRISELSIVLDRVCLQWVTRVAPNDYITFKISGSRLLVW